MKNLFKGIISTVLAGSVLMSVAACTKFNLIDYRDFQNALEEQVGLEEDDCRTGKNKKREGYQMKRYIIGSKGSTSFVFYEFDEEDDAVEYFEKNYDSYLDALEEDEDFDGSHKESFDGDSATGYILIDAEHNGASAYGGLFLKENTFITVLTTSSKDKERERVDAVLDAIGYPKP